MKRSIAVLLVCFSFVLALTGCGGTVDASGDVLSAELPTEIESASGDVIYDALPIEALVSESNYGIKATYRDLEEYDGYVYFRFDVNEVLYGGYSEQELYVYELLIAEDMSKIYTPGQQYLLVLMDGITGVAAEHTHYVSVRPDVDFPVDGPYLLYGEEITPPDGQTMEEYLRVLASQYANTASAQSEETDYADSTEELIGESAFIGYVTIESVVNATAANTTLYAGTVTSLVQGSADSMDTREDGSVWLCLVKDSVTVGQSYLIGFTPTDEGSTLYNQATLDSIIPNNDSDRIQQILDALS